MNPRGGPAVRLRWSGQTDCGHVRKNNEDSFLGQQFNAQEVHHLGKVGEGTTELVDFVFAVSDGMGGAMAGEFASRITTEKITRLLPASFKQSALGLTAGVDDVLEELFDQIHRSLVFVGSSYEETHNMQATLSMCWFTPGWMYFAHIGDTRIYYLPAAGGIKQLSEDDTHVGWLYRQGRLTEMQARDHPQRTALQKALGAGNQFVTPQIGGVAHEPGDLFLLCSDGLVEGLYDYQILEILRPTEPVTAPQPPAFRLVEEALQRSGRDNTTALVVEVA
jgi:serine/threonine protein phosphatase PrpC